MTHAERYTALTEKMQRGIAQLQGEEQLPIVLASCNLHALIGLLVNQGVLTRKKIDEALADELEHEVYLCERKLSAVLGGVKVKL